MALGPHVTVLEQGDRKIYLVGTAHISEASVKEVRETIEEVQPDTVCVELCKNRYESLVNADRFKQLDIFKVIKEKKVLFVLAQLALSSYQKKMGDKLGVRPGAEQIEAMKAAEDTGAQLVLADRDIQATLKRTWHNIGFFKKFSVLGALLEGFLTKGEEVTEEDLEKLKDKDQISEMMAAFAKELHEVQVPLIDERDHYLMSSIENAPGKKIVAVVGAGHVEGIKRYFGQPVDKAELEKIPPARLWTKIVGWSIPVLILAAFYFGWREHQGTGLLKLILAWVIPTGGLAALFSIVALAHPLTVLSALLAAPITTLHPILGVGMFTGVVEAWMHKPTVEDAEKIADEATHLKGYYKNRFLHVLLVFFLSSVGASIGLWVGATWIAKLLVTE